MAELSKSDEKYNAIIHGTIWKELILYTMPLIFGTFFQQLYNTVDAVVVGRFVGKTALSCVGGTSGVIVNIFLGFFLGISSGASAIVAQYMGADNKEGTSLAVHTAYAIALASGVILSIAGFVLAPVFTRFMGTPSEVAEGTIIYLRIYFLGMIPNLVYNMGAGILRAVGDSRRPLIFLIISCFVNIILDLIFVLLLGLGVAGVAIATILCQLISAIMVTTALMSTDAIYKLHLRRIGFSRIQLTRILYIGIPAGIQSLMYTVSNVFIQASVNSFGTDTVAAYTAYGKIDSIFWMFCNASGIAVTTFVAQNYGAGLHKRVRECVKQSVVLVSLVTVCISVVFYFFAYHVFSLFTTDQSVMHIGRQMVEFLAPFYLTYIGIEIFSGALRGLGDALIPMIIDVICICVLRVVWILMIVPNHHTILFVLASFPITWATASIVFVLYYLRYIKKNHILEAERI